MRRYRLIELRAATWSAVAMRSSGSANGSARSSVQEESWGGATTRRGTLAVGEGSKHELRVLLLRGGGGDGPWLHMHQDVTVCFLSPGCWSGRMRHPPSTRPYALISNVQPFSHWRQLSTTHPRYCVADLPGVLRDLPEQDRARVSTGLVGTLAANALVGDGERDRLGLGDPPRGRDEVLAGRIHCGKTDVSSPRLSLPSPRRGTDRSPAEQQTSSGTAAVVPSC